MEGLKVKYTPTILDFEAGLDSYEQAKEALRRWECHAELLEACKQLIKALNQIPNQRVHGEYETTYKLIVWAESTIAKAEGRA